MQIDFFQALIFFRRRSSRRNPTITTIAPRAQDFRAVQYAISSLTLCFDRYVKAVEPEVRGVVMDAETRCIHYHSALDIIAIKMACCGVYYACKDCHEVLAGHAIEVWPHSQWKRSGNSVRSLRVRADDPGIYGQRLFVPALWGWLQPRLQKPLRLLFCPEATA